MPTFSSSQIQPPSNWQDFQRICRDLWAKIWNDPDTKENGRLGQSQNGVDIYGRPDQKKEWGGVQCKGKDNYSKQQQLTKKELREEVEKAKTFTPKLSQFILATTTPRDANIQIEERKITTEHQESGLFSVSVWFWEDIKNELEIYPDLIEKHYPTWASTTKKISDEIRDLKTSHKESLNEQKQAYDDIRLSLKDIEGKIDDSPKVAYSDIIADTLSAEYHKELDHSKNLLLKYSAKEALEYLDDLKNNIWNSAPSSVKYRILTNKGSALLQLRQEKEAAEFFIQAYQYNPDDEKAMCNIALAYLLLGNKAEAQKWCVKVLEKNPANLNAISLNIQTIEETGTLDTIIESVPHSCSVKS